MGQKPERHKRFVPLRFLAMETALLQPPGKVPELATEAAGGLIDCMRAWHFPMRPKDLQHMGKFHAILDLKEPGSGQPQPYQLTVLQGARKGSPFVDALVLEYIRVRKWHADTVRALDAAVESIKALSPEQKDQKRKIVFELINRPRGDLQLVADPDKIAKYRAESMAGTCTDLETEVRQVVDTYATEIIKVVAPVTKPRWKTENATVQLEAELEQGHTFFVAVGQSCLESKNEWNQALADIESVLKKVKDLVAKHGTPEKLKSLKVEDWYDDEKFERVKTAITALTENWNPDEAVGEDTHVAAQVLIESVLQASKEYEYYDDGSSAVKNFGPHLRKVLNWTTPLERPRLTKEITALEEHSLANVRFVAYLLLAASPEVRARLDTDMTKMGNLKGDRVALEESKQSCSVVPGIVLKGTLDQIKDIMDKDGPVHVDRQE